VDAAFLMASILLRSLESAFDIIDFRFNQLRKKTTGMLKLIHVIETRELLDQCSNALRNISTRLETGSGMP